MHRPTRARLPALLLALTVAATVLGLSACNTVEGVGEDVEQAGDAIQDSSAKTRDQM